MPNTNHTALSPHKHRKLAEHNARLAKVHAELAKIHAKEADMPISEALERPDAILRKYARI